MTTPRDIIEAAMRKINVVRANETPSADDVNIALLALNALNDSFSNDKLMIYSINPYIFNTVGGQSDYTLGPGGDWNVSLRPMAIEQMYTRWNFDLGAQAVDLEIGLLNDQQFASIAVKQTPSTFPFWAYDNGNYPLRTITVFPVPTAATEVVLWLKQPLSDFTSATLDVDINYPPGYVRAYIYNLAVEIAPEFGKAVAQSIIDTAISSKKELALSNADIPYMNCDGAMNDERRQWNWITGNMTPTRW